MVTETTAGRSYHKTYSSDGTVSSVQDPGGTIYYTYYPDGKVKTITAPGTIITQMEYDIAGNQTRLIDPSAGTINYAYNGFGELLTQQNARLQTTTNTYYSDGRIERKVTPDGTTKYRYNSNKLLSNVNSYGTVSHTYAYDTKGRVTSVTDTIPGTTPLITSYTYDALGRSSTITHPSGLVETNNYNSFGYLFRIDAAGSAVWTTSSMNARGQITAGQYGTNLAAGYGYDSFGFRTSITAGANNSTQNFTYGFNATTGNLSWRQNNNGTDLKETFNYDNLDRLDNVYKGISSPTMTLDMAYDPNKGGITTKTDVGTLMYSISGKPYAVSNINPVTSVVPVTLDSLTYTSFESVSTIEEGAYFASFVYNPEDQRAKMEVKQNGSVILTRWYLGSNYIKETSSGVTREYTFIGGNAYTAPVVSIKQNGVPTTYYLLRDHLGSITHVVNASTGSTTYEYSYDAWGRMRNTANWTNYSPGSEPVLFIAGRGFTGHEHLPWFNLINMNGRVYDPLTGQFLNVDNNVQSPDFTQNFNRYAYCLNNPLKYTDPSGEFLTWSFHNGGFSIGFNLTPIGIPIGFGINIGWGDGFSMGGYGEVGYRVGGTGFGSGATVSQSFDYNFKNNGWTGTTAEGAYASLGAFNAGANISQTYDFASSSWSNGWGVSFGIGFGNDARGIGFNIGYGSSGFTYGMGGYYNSRAWESNPVYEPEAWNDNGEIQTTNNCYSYALDDRENGNYWGLQPGDAGGQPITSLSDVTLEYVTNAAISDGRIKNPSFWNKLGFGKKGYYSAYLVIDESVDYHWYRQDKGGLWSHKPGITSVLNVDASHHLIRNPAFANHGNYNNGGRFLWIKRR